MSILTSAPLVAVTSSLMVAPSSDLHIVKTKRSHSSQPLSALLNRSRPLWASALQPPVPPNFLTFSYRSTLGSRVTAFNDNGNGGGSGSSGSNSWESLEIEVPPDQRPVNELAALKVDSLYSWAQLELPAFAARLGGLWFLFFFLLGGPIAAASFNPGQETLRFLLAGSAGACFAVSLLVLRIYLGWSYVGNRLLSAVIPYEETGWYDGQMWVKPPEILARDRLVGSYQVKPILSRLKKTLLASASLLAASTLSLSLLAPLSPADDSFVFVPRANVANRSASVEYRLTPSLRDKGSASDIAPTITSEEPEVADEEEEGAQLEMEMTMYRARDLVNLPAEQLAADDDLAAAAAAAARGRPVYCMDRYHRALAGGQYCKWEDLQTLQ